MEIKIEQPDLVLCDFTNPQHCAALCDLINEYITHPMGGGEPLSDSQKLRLLDGLESHPKAITLFVLKDGAIAGVLNAFVNFSTFKCKPMINVHDVFVSDAYRGKGLGRKLIQGIIEIGKNLSCGKITLEVRVDNPTAQNLYKSEGFEEGNDPMYFWTRYLH